MPTTVTSSSGTSYHLLQLPCGVSGSTESIGFSELENDLGDSFYAQVLFGSATGNRSWKLDLPSLPSSVMTNSTVTGIDGALVSKEEYLWSLFCESKVSGQPFAIQSSRNDQYYLVRFVDQQLSYQRMLTKLYSTGIELKQIRIPGETIFNPLVNSGNLIGWYDETSWHSPSTTGWAEKSSGNGGYQLDLTGDVVHTAAVQNGLAAQRFNAVGATGVLISDAPLNTAIFEAFIVMKMREVTFSNNTGIINDTSTNALLVGTNGGTKFQDLSLGAGFEYRLNGVLYASSNQQAPMNTWGVVHVRNPSSPVFSHFQVGQNKGVAGTFAKADIGEIQIYTTLPKSQSREITESLTVKWGIAQ